MSPVYFLIANLFNIAQGVSMGLYTIAMANLLDCAEGGGIAQRLHHSHADAADAGEQIRYPDLTHTVPPIPEKPRIAHEKGAARHPAKSSAA